MIKLLYIAAGGAFGTLFRYWVSGFAYRAGGTGFPWGTLAVNLLGSFLIGLAFGLSDRITLPPNLRNMLFIGIFGGFTTFSTLMYEGFAMFRDADIKLSLIYLLVSNILGLLLVYSGFIGSRLMMQIIK
jgi:CrcB protein